LESFKRKITKSGTVFCITIPNHIAYKMKIERGSSVFTEIKLDSTLLFRGTKKVTVIGKMLAIVLPKSKAFGKIWNMLYQRGAQLDVTIFTIDEILDRITSSS